LSELLGGTVGVESTVGKGSTFRFSLVGKVVDQPRLRALPVNVGAPVSVVSEDNAARSILARHVESLGLIASPVASVAAALEAAAAHESDLLLFDARGSVEETKSVLRMVRAASATLPILLLASPRTPALGGSELADALVATLFKPVKTGRLLEVIEALLAGQPVPARASSIDDLEPPPPATTSGGTVLVVDDNALNRRVAIEMVRRLGLSAQSVASGAEAIAAVGRARFDYVLMDVQMPDMDGFEATRRILEVAEKVRKTKPRVIAMTANALPGDRERCLAAGMTDYITKPVRPAALAAALKRRYDGAAGDGERSGITDVLDAQVLEDLRMLEETSGATLIADLAAQFRVDVPARIEELQAAARGSDVVSLRSIAHRLRGSAGAVGANRVFVTATEIESSAGLMAAPGMEALVAQLAKEATRAIDAFDRLLERMKREKGAPSESPELPP
jgi:CheY-like chemotaxis protein